MTLVLHTENITWWRVPPCTTNWVTGWVDEERATAFLRKDEKGDAVVEGWM